MSPFSSIPLSLRMAVKVGKKYPATIFRVPQLFFDVPQLFLEPQLLLAGS